MRIELCPPESAKTWVFEFDSLAELDRHIADQRLSRSLADRHPASRDGRVGRVVDRLIADLEAWRVAWVDAEVQQCRESWWGPEGQSGVAG